MSSSVGQILTVYNRIWTLLEANTDWAALVKPGCRIKTVNNPTNGFSIAKPSKAPADTPEAKLEITGPFRDTLYTVGETFDTMKNTFDPKTETWVEYITATFLLTLTTRSFVVDEFDPLALLTLDALRDGGPKLGISFVRRIGDLGRGIQADVKRTSKGEAAGNFRTVTRLTIPVLMQFEGRTLVTP